MTFYRRGTALPRLMCRPNRMPVKVSAGFPDELDLMFMRKGSRTRTGKVLVKRGHESEDLCYGWRVQLWLPGRLAVTRQTCSSGAQGQG